MSSDKYYMELEAENKELKEENKELNEALDKWVNPSALGMMNKQATKLYQELQKENKELKELVDYDGLKLQILETEVNNAMEYIDEAIERYLSPNPMVHKSSMLADFDKLKKLLMN